MKRKLVLVCCDCGNTPDEAIVVMDKYFKGDIRPYRVYISTQIINLINSVPTSSQLHAYLKALRSAAGRYAYAYAYDPETYHFAYADLIDGSIESLMRVKEFAGL